MEEMGSLNKRIDYFDIAKGIGIILMIVGHMGWNAKSIYIDNFIYAFHMPMFFIISGFFFKPKSNKECLKKILKKLITPYIVTCIIIIVYKVFEEIFYGNYNNIYNVIKQWGIASILGSGKRQIFNFTTTIGAIWFLLAISFSTYFLNKVYNKKYSYIYVLLIFYIGYKTSQFVWLPFSIQSGMTGLLFMYIGCLMKKYDIFNKKIDVLFWLFIIGTFSFCCIFCGKLYLVENVFNDGIIDIVRCRMW